MDNLVETFVASAKRVVRIAASRRWLALGVTAASALAGAAIIAAVPERYEATARVFVDTQTVLKPLMAGLTFQPDIDQQVQMLARTLISRPNVERLVLMPELQLNGSSDREREAAVSHLMSRIKMVSAGSGNLYEIKYRDSNPERARRLVEATVGMFVHANSGAKKQDSQEAARFIQDQIRSYETKLVDAENRLKEFKLRNFGVSGVSTQDYFSRVSVLTEQVGKLRVDLSAAERSRDSYRRELALEDPQLPAELAVRSGSAALTELETRLDLQKKQLDDLLRRYTEAHPDVISARRAVEQLTVEARDKRDAEERAVLKAGKQGKAATSPVYQKLRISIAEAEAQVASLRSQLSAQQVQLEQIRALAGRVPQVEAELAQLNRDYDVIRKNYEVMVARRESASLGERLTESSHLAEFQVVEPPRVPLSPVFPGRLHLAVLVIAASLALGVAAAVLADLTWPTFDEAASLSRFADRPVLGTVSMLATPLAQRERRMSLVRFTAAFALVVTAQAGWVAWIALNPQLQ